MKGKPKRLVLMGSMVAVSSAYPLVKEELEMARSLPADLAVKHHIAKRKDNKVEGEQASDTGCIFSWGKPLLT